MDQKGFCESLYQQLIINIESIKGGLSALMT